MRYTVEVDTLEEKSVIPCSRWNDHNFDECFTQKRITQSITIIAILGFDPNSFTKYFHYNYIHVNSFIVRARG